MQQSKRFRLAGIDKEQKKTYTINAKKARWSHLDTTLLTDSLIDNMAKPFWKHIKNLRQDNVGVAPINHKGKLFSEHSAKSRTLPVPIRFYPRNLKKEPV